MSKEKGKRNAVLVSVIIPAFNVDQYIETCIRSVLEQDMKDLFASKGFEHAYMSGADMDAYAKQQLDYFGELLPSLGLGK